MTILFLPGAGASAAFWRPVADRLPPGRRHEFLSWPGLGAEPPDPRVRGIDDLVGLVLARLPEPADLVAQSMGGLVALKVALAVPGKVRRMVLAVTSGGVPMPAPGEPWGDPAEDRSEEPVPVDWRAEYRRTYPDAAAWITQVREDLSAALGGMQAPTLLLWGDADPISPPVVGHRLQGLLPDAVLHILPGAGHDLARTHAEQVAPLIDRHLRRR